MESAEEELASDTAIEFGKEYEYECIHCGAVLKAGDKVCPQCGDNVEQVVGMENSNDSEELPESEVSENSGDANEDFFCAKCGKEISETDNFIISRSTRNKYTDLDALIEAEGSGDWLPLCANCFNNNEAGAEPGETRGVQIKDEACENDFVYQAASGTSKCPRCHSEHTKEYLNFDNTDMSRKKFKCTSCRYEW